VRSPIAAAVAGRGASQLKHVVIFYNSKYGPRPPAVERSKMRRSAATGEAFT